MVGEWGEALRDDPNNGCEGDYENREHLKNFRNVDCVLANYNKVQDMQSNYKTTN